MSDPGPIAYTSIVRDDWPEARKATYRAIEHKIASHPRSQQTRIGPSEIGQKCERRIGYTLLGTPKRPQPVAWRPTVGTAVHTWLEDALDVWDSTLVTLGLAQTDEQLHWMVEQRVPVGRLGDMLIDGSLDSYHRPTCTIIDHKILGASSLKAKRSAHHPGDQYKVQQHLYGLGMTMLGYEVREVAINALPSAGELKDGWWWSEPFDPLIAQTAFFRVQAIHDLTVRDGDAALADLEPVESYCHNCPWYSPGSTNLTTGCPGVMESADASSGFEGLLGPQSATKQSGK